MKGELSIRRLLAVMFTIVLVATLGGLAWRVAGGRGSAGTRTAIVKRGTLKAAIVTSGRLVARQTTSVSSIAGGQVKVVAVRGGEEVRRGDVVVVLDDVPARAEIARAESAVEAAEIRVGVARARAARDGNALPEVAIAEREADAARAALAAANDRLVATLLLAPFDGVVDAVRVGEGGAYAPGTEALTIVNAAELVVSADLDEVDQPRVSEGQEVEVTVTSFPSAPITGRVASLSMVAQSRGGTTVYPLTVEFEPPGGVALQPGMSVELRIPTKASDAVLLLPGEAVRRAGERQYVTVRRDGREVDVPVRTGARSGGEVEIASGLNEGEEVILR